MNTVLLMISAIVIDVHVAKTHVSALHMPLILEH